MSLNLTTYSYFTLPVFVISFAMAAYIWRHRSKRGAKGLIFLASGIGVWGLGYAFELGAAELPTKLFWAKVQYLGIVTVPLGWLLFVLQYTGQDRWITRRNLALLATVPFITLVLVWTNEAHGLIWSSTTLDAEGSSLFLMLDYGAWFWLFWAYSYLMLLLGTLLLGSVLSRSSRLYRGQRLALLIAIFMPWLGNAIYVLDLGPLPDLDLTPFGFLLAALAVTLGLVRFQFMDLIPVAHRSIVESMRENVVVVDLEDRIVELNPAAQRILGCPAERAVGQGAAQVVPGWSFLLEGYRKAGRVSEDIRLGEGLDQRLYDPVLSSLRDNKGQEIGYLLTLHDITERHRSEKQVRELNEDLEEQVAERARQLEALVDELKEREQALRRSEEYFRSLLQHASDVITLVDAEGNILYESPSVQRILGYSPEEMNGTNALDYVHPEDLQKVSESLEAGIAGEYNGPPLELRFRTRDSSWRHLEVVANNQLGNPSVRGVVINSRDVTARRRAEQQLQQTEERYRNIFENAVEGIFQASKDGWLLTANPSMARILGYESSEDLLENAPQIGEFFVDPEHGAEFFGLVLEQGSASGFESRLRRKDGGVIWAYKNSRVLYDGDGELAGYEGSIEDVTDRKHAQQSIQRSLNVMLALHEAGQILGSTLQAEEIGSRALEIMKRVLNLTAVVISTQDEEGQLRIWRSVGLQGLRPRARFEPEAEAARNEALENGPRSFQLAQPGPDGESLKGLCLPMRVRGRTIGVLEGYGKDVVENEAVGILGSLASQAASALENARLYRELTGREGQLQDLVSTLISAQEEERRRVAYEIHDGLAQVAVAAHQHLQAFARRQQSKEDQNSMNLDLILRLVRRTVTEARQIIADLRPTTLDDFGLAAAIVQEIENLRDDGYQIEYQEELGEERLPDKIEITLFRIVQEAINNIRKHAGTQQVSVLLARQNGEVRLEVRDWGHGFDLSGSNTKDGPGERVGVAGMRERIDILGGDFEIKSQPGQGTVVSVSIPLRLVETLGIKGER